MTEGESVEWRRTEQGGQARRHRCRLTTSRRGTEFTAVFEAQEPLSDWFDCPQPPRRNPTQPLPEPDQVIDPPTDDQHEQKLQASNPMANHNRRSFLATLLAALAALLGFKARAAGAGSGPAAPAPPAQPELQGVELSYDAPGPVITYVHTYDAEGRLVSVQGPLLQPSPRRHG